MIIKKDLIMYNQPWNAQSAMELAKKQAEKENKTLERFFDLLDVMDMEW